MVGGVITARSKQELASINGRDGVEAVCVGAEHFDCKIHLVFPNSPGVAFSADWRGKKKGARCVPIVFKHGARASI